jgi:hypothetical protein
MLKEPTLYSVGADYQDGDATLEQKVRRLDFRSHASIVPSRLTWTCILLTRPA